MTGTSPRTILIADDEELLRTLIKIVFEKEGYQVITAADGKEAVELIILEKPDLVILDYNMPKMNGLEALNEIICLEHVPYAVLHSANDNISFQAQPADAYVIKSATSLKELIAVVAKLLGSQNQEAAV